MLFNSLAFAIFYPIIFILYWFVCHKQLKLQNILLLVASYYFYACWDWRFLFLLLFSTVLDFYTGLKIEESSTERMRKVWLWISVGTNLGFLGFFKYYNFFVVSFAELLQGFGIGVNPWTLAIILPVGISFYTFHGLSYVIDIYLKRIKAERDFIDYGLFVSFFPLLVAGPIERATHLLPQLKKTRTFTYERGVDGARQILWGLFKKIVIADNCAVHVNEIFAHYEAMPGSTLLLGALLFTFQIYGDFSGYSDIALGTARLLGIELLKNFNFPYFSRDIAEFWRRWHISLSSWFRDYVYIPLGGSKGGLAMKIRNTFIIFLLSGFWHGANWTFIVWGALNAIYFLPLLLTKNNRKNMDVVAQGRLLPSFREFIGIGITFTLTVFAWIFFRAESVGQALDYIGGIFSPTLWSKPVSFYTILVPPILFLLIVEWFGRSGNFALEHLMDKWSKPMRYAFYYLILMMLFIFIGEPEEFIYFQF